MANLDQIEKYIRQKKLPYKLVNLKAVSYTVDDVKRAGVDEDEIVKTLVVRTISGTDSSRTLGRTFKFAALAIRGNDKVDFKKARQLLGSKTELARPEEVLLVIGVPIGAVCPVLVGVPLYFDKRVMDLENVHMGSGDLEYGLEMKLPDLLMACEGYKVEDLV